MCVVSAVTDHYQREWGYPWIGPAPGVMPAIDPPFLIRPLLPDVSKFPPTPPVLEPKKVEITKEEWEEYQRLKKAAEEIDQKTNQPDCIKPDLAEWEERMEEFLIKKGVLPGKSLDWTGF